MLIEIHIHMTDIFMKGGAAGLPAMSGTACSICLEPIDDGIDAYKRRGAKHHLTVGPAGASWAHR